MMRLLNFSVSAVLLFAVISFGYANSAQEFEKLITKEFDINANGQVDLDNRHGNIDIETWNENRVKIEVKITADAKDQESANKIFDAISVDFTNTSSLVRATTDIDQPKNWKSWFGSDNKKFEIYYHVWLPASVSIDVENKYGDIYIAETQGEIDIILKYGNLRMDGTDKDVSLDMGYGKGTVGNTGDFDINMKYSKLECGDMGDVRGDTKYSTFVTGNVNAVRVNTSYDNYRIASATSFSNVGKYDDFDFASVGDVSLNTKYTNFSAEKMTGNGDFESKYGAISVDDLNGFTMFEVNSEYTGVKLKVAENMDFIVDASGSHSPIRHSNLSVTKDIQKSSESTLYGHRGSENATAKIISRMRYGSLKIQ